MMYIVWAERADKESEKARHISATSCFWAAHRYFLESYRDGDIKIHVNRRGDMGYISDGTEYSTKMFLQERYGEKPYVVIGGQHKNVVYGEFNSYSAAKECANKHGEWWDNYQGWKEPLIYWKVNTWVNENGDRALIYGAMPIYEGGRN